MSGGWWFGSMIPGRSLEKYITEFKIPITTEEPLGERDSIKKYESVVKDTLTKSIYYLLKFKAHGMNVELVHSVKTGENAGFIFVDILFSCLPSELINKENELSTELNMISFHMVTNLKFKLLNPILMWSVRTYKPDE